MDVTKGDLYGDALKCIRVSGDAATVFALFPQKIEPLNGRKSETFYLMRACGKNKKNAGTTNDKTRHARKLPPTKSELADLTE